MSSKGTATTSTLPLPSGVSGDFKFYGITNADDGKLYCAPASASVVLVVEGITPSPSAASSASSASALNDNALGIDRLGYALYGKALVAVIKSAETPLSVGLYAQWGSGKTFFICASSSACFSVFDFPSSIVSCRLFPLHPPSLFKSNERTTGQFIRCRHERTRILRHRQEAPRPDGAGEPRQPRPQAALPGWLRFANAHRCRYASGAGEDRKCSFGRSWLRRADVCAAWYALESLWHFLLFLLAVVHTPALRARRS